MKIPSSQSSRLFIIIGFQISYNFAYGTRETEKMHADDASLTEDARNALENARRKYRTRARNLSLLHLRHIRLCI